MTRATAARVARPGRDQPAALPLQNLALVAHLGPSHRSGTGAAPRKGPYATGHEQRTAHPRRPARGRRRSREPPLPGLRRAALRLALRAPRPARPGPPLRELRPRRRRRPRRPRGGPARAWPWRRGRRSADRQPRQLRRLARQRRLGRAGAAAPATSSRSSRCGGWSPVATRSSSPAAGRPRPSLAATWQTLLNSVTFGHNVALAALGRGARRRRRSAGSAGSTPWPASSWRSRPC